MVACPWEDEYFCSFSWYSYLQIQAKQEAQKQENKQLLVENDEELGSSSTESEE